MSKPDSLSGSGGDESRLPTSGVLAMAHDIRMYGSGV